MLLLYSVCTHCLTSLVSICCTVSRRRNIPPQALRRERGVICVAGSEVDGGGAVVHAAWDRQCSLRWREGICVHNDKDDTDMTPKSNASNVDNLNSITFCSPLFLAKKRISKSCFAFRGFSTNKQGYQYLPSTERKNKSLGCGVAKKQVANCCHLQRVKVAWKNTFLPSCNCVVGRFLFLARGLVCLWFLFLLLLRLF